MNKILRKLKIKMSREFKVGNCWKGRKFHLKMYVTEQKPCNLLPQIKIKTKQNKNVNKCGRWKVQNRAVVALYRKK